MKLGIREYRLIKTLTQEKVAEKSNLSEYRYRKIEKNPSMATVTEGKNIAKALGVNFEDIFFTNEL